MWRKVLVVLLTLVLVTVGGLFGCAPAPTETATPAGPIKIGILGPLTFMGGQHLLWAAQIAADEINKAGGVKIGKGQRAIELVPVDTNEMVSTPDAVSAFERAITVDKVDFIVGGYLSNVALATQEVAMDNKKIFILSVGVADPPLIERVAQNYARYKYTFRVANSSQALLDTMRRQLDYVGKVVRKEVGVAKPKVAVMMDKAAWTEPMVAASNEIITGLGMEPVGVWRPSMMATDVTAELTAIRAAQPHIIWIALGGAAGVPFSRQYRELQIPAAVVGVNPNIAQATGWEKTEGGAEYQTIVALAGIRDVKRTPKTVAFVEEFLSRNKTTPISADGYNAVYTLKEAIERAGTLDSDAVVTELEKTKFVGADQVLAFQSRSEAMPHDLKTGVGYSIIPAAQWQAGKLVIVWPVKDDPAEWRTEFEGTVPIKLPPWMIEYWKKK
ncbi:MAG: ABC transporter substrate-binding protein [Chloroflexi bacterium]|nr:ABC transporter substrate-binding protein [Chloroflexota bacterium]